MPLDLKITSQRSTAWDGFVRIQIREAASARDRIYSFKELFERYISEYKRDSVGSPNMFYKVFFEGDIYAAKVCEVWHVTVMGDKKRKVAIVTQENS